MRSGATPALGRRALPVAVELPPIGEPSSTEPMLLRLKNRAVLRAPLLVVLVMKKAKQADRVQILRNSFHGAGGAAHDPSLPSLSPFVVNATRGWGRGATRTAASDS